MADLPVVKANVKPVRSFIERTDPVSIQAIEHILQGQPVYTDETELSLRLASALTQASANVTGIAVSEAYPFQWASILQSQGNIDLGCPLQVGQDLVLSSTPGKICPYADLGADDWITRFGVTSDADNLIYKLDVTNIQFQPVANPNQPYNTLVVAPSSPYTRNGRGCAIRDWGERILAAQVRANVPSGRTTTYYVSQSRGNDGNPGTIAQPWKTWARAVAAIAASTGDIRIRLCRGDIWLETPACTIAKNKVTIDDYVDPLFPATERPYINGFTSFYDDSAWATDTGFPNTYWRYEPIAPGWVRPKYVRETYDFTGDQTPLKREDSVAHCRAFPKSYFYDTGTNRIYMNTGGPNPNFAQFYEMVPMGTGTFNVTGDNVRLQNIAVHGTGFSPDGSGVGLQVFHSSSGVYYEFVGIDCDFIYTGYHSIVHVTAADNRMLLVRCRAGYCTNRSGTGTAGSGDTNPINSYAGSGGQEYIVLRCGVVGGTLPSWDWAAQAGQNHSSAGVFVHTNDPAASQPKLAMVVGTNYYENNPFHAAGGTAVFGPSSGSDLITDARAWIIGENVAVPGPFTNMGIGKKDRVWINCKFALNRDAADTSGVVLQGTSDFPLKGWCINCHYKVTITGGNATIDNVLYHNNGGSLPCDVILIHCRLEVIGIQHLGSWRYVDTDCGSRARFLNCEFTAADTGVRAGYGAFYSSSGSISTSTYNCCAIAQPNDRTAYPTMYPPAGSTGLVHYTMGATIPDTAPVTGDLRFGTGGANALEYDIDENPRDGTRHDIGPHVGIPV